MKIFLSLLIIVLSSSFVFTQTKQEKEIRLSVKEIKKRIIKEEFLDIPQEVKNCHGTGILTLRVKVDQNGIVKSLQLISGICPKVNEYIVKAVENWKFKPLRIDNENVSFRGFIQVPFCYGAFGGC